MSPGRDTTRRQTSSRTRSQRASSTRSAPTGLYKTERVIDSRRAPTSASPTAPRCSTSARTTTSGWPTTRGSSRAAKEALDRWGYGLASVRFICGTQDVHKELERRCPSFLGTEDTILYSSCFDANGGLFETLLGEQDAVISDELNHASIIDGIRLCKARRLRYRNRDMADLRGAAARRAAGAGAG